MALNYPADVNIFACVCIDEPKCTPKDPALLAYCLEKLQGNFIANAEHDKTLMVMMQLEQLLGREIVWVRGKSFDHIIREHGCLPSKVNRFCTTEMKIQAMFEYSYPRFGKVKANIGFRGDELERILKAGKVSVFKSEVSCFLTSNYHRFEEIEWQELAFPLRSTYHYEIIQYWRKVHPEFAFPDDSNCQGCFHKPKELINRNYQETPEHLQWFADQEKLTGYSWHPGKRQGRPSYEKTFQMQFTEEIDFSNFTMCNSGGCTD